MVGVQPDGSPFRKSFYGKTQGEAKKKFATFQAQRNAGIILSTKSITLGELADRWLELKRQRGAISENTYDEVACFLAHVQPHRLYSLFYTAVVTGMRRGELVALRWKDVDAVKNRIHVRRNAVDIHGTVHAGEPKTKASRRIIHVQEDDIRILLEHKHRQKKSERAWVRRGLTLTSCSRHNSALISTHATFHVCSSVLSKVSR